MTILSDDEFKAALKWKVLLGKTATRTTVALNPFSVFDLAGQPGAGTLAVGNTANGIKPTQAISGYPAFPDAAAGKGWYLAAVEGQSSVACERAVYDFVFSAGAYNFNANINLTAQPDFTDRIRIAPPWAASTDFRAGDLVTNGTNPIKAYVCTAGGTSAGSGGPTTTGSSISDGSCTWRYCCVGVSWACLEAFVEQVTAATGNQAVQLNPYQEALSDGFSLTGRTPAAQGVGAAPIVGRMWRLPLSFGSQNIARIDNVTGSVATAGTFNVHLARRLDASSHFVSPFTDPHGYDRTGLVYVPNGAALREIYTMSSTASATGPTTLTLAMG